MSEYRKGDRVKVKATGERGQVIELMTVVRGHHHKGSFITDEIIGDKDLEIMLDSKISTIQPASAIELVPPRLCCVERPPKLYPEIGSYVFCALREGHSGPHLGTTDDPWI